MTFTLTHLTPLPATVATTTTTHTQVTHILACAELYFSSRAKLQAEQRALQAQLKAAELSPLDLLGGDADNPLRCVMCFSPGFRCLVEFLE